MRNTRKHSTIMLNLCMCLINFHRTVPGLVHDFWRRLECVGMISEYNVSYNCIMIISAPCKYSFKANRKWGLLISTGYTGIVKLCALINNKEVEKIQNTPAT